MKTISQKSRDFRCKPSLTLPFVSFSRTEPLRGSGSILALTIESQCASAIPPSKAYPPPSGQSIFAVFVRFTAPKLVYKSHLHRRLQPHQPVEQTAVRVPRRHPPTSPRTAVALGGPIKSRPVGGRRGPHGLASLGADPGGCRCTPLRAASPCSPPARKPVSVTGLLQCRQ